MQKEEENKPVAPVKGDIHARMVRILREVGSIGKNQENTFHRFKFRGIDDVLNEVHRTFAANGVFIMPKLIARELIERKTQKGDVAFHHFVTINYRFIAEDGSFIETEIVGESADNQDKGINKAYSIALKYLLIQALLIPVEDLDDPDKDSHNFGQKRSGSNGSNGNPKGREPSNVTYVEPEDPRELVIHFGKNKGLKLGELTKGQVSFIVNKWEPRPNPNTNKVDPRDILLKNCAKKVFDALKQEEAKKAEAEAKEAEKKAKEEKAKEAQAETKEPVQTEIDDSGL